MIAIVDAGPLYAAIDDDDSDHDRSLQVFRRRDLDFIVPPLVIAEVCYFVNKNLDANVEAAFLRSLSQYEVIGPAREDWNLIANLVQRYSDFPLGGTDASVAVLAERLGTDTIVTLDRRHFGALRLSDGRPFTLLPE